MKWSTRILILMFSVFIVSIVIANIILKNKYDKIDKSDTYWTYGKVSDQHFKYLKIEGGNVTNIAFEQSPNCSVRVLHDWQRVRPNPVETHINDDTLYIKFTYVPANEGEIDWMRRLTLVRVFSPELSYIEGHNTKFNMFKLRQSNIRVNMSGKSQFEVESFVPDFDSVQVSQSDSSEIVFEMSPEYKPLADKRPFPESGQRNNKNTNNERFNIDRLSANLRGNTLLDVGRAKIKSLQLNISDTSAIILPGTGLRTFCRQKF